MPSLSIRAITANDWQTYKTLRLQSLQDAPNAFGSTYAEEVERSDEAWATRVQNALGSQKAQIFFALIDDQACGLVWCKLLDDKETAVALYQMWVALQALRCGAGSALIEAAIAWASSKAARRLLLEVHSVRLAKRNRTNRDCKAASTPQKIRAEIIPTPRPKTSNTLRFKNSFRAIAQRQSHLGGRHKHNNEMASLPNCTATANE